MHMIRTENCPDNQLFCKINDISVSKLVWSNWTGQIDTYLHHIMSNDMTITRQMTSASWHEYDCNVNCSSGYKTDSPATIYGNSIKFCYMLSMILTIQ